MDLTTIVIVTAVVLGVLLVVLLVIASVVLLPAVRRALTVRQRLDPVDEEGIEQTEAR